MCVCYKLFLKMFTSISNIIGIFLKTTLLKHFQKYVITKTFIHVCTYIQSTPDKSESQGTWKSVRLTRCPTYPRLRIACK